MLLKQHKYIPSNITGKYKGSKQDYSQLGKISKIKNDNEPQNKPKASKYSLFPTLSINIPRSGLAIEIVYIKDCKLPVLFLFTPNFYLNIDSIW